MRMVIRSKCDIDNEHRHTKEREYGLLRLLACFDYLYRGTYLGVASGTRPSDVKLKLFLWKLKLLHKEMHQEMKREVRCQNLLTCS